MYEYSVNGTRHFSAAALNFLEQYTTSFTLCSVTFGGWITPTHQDETKYLRVKLEVDQDLAESGDAKRDILY